MTPIEFDALSVMMGNHANSPSLEALRLVLVDGLTQKEAAAKVGVTHQTVGQKMTRARELHAASKVLAGAKMPEKRAYPAAS